jgi:hypothetical protein
MTQSTTARYLSLSALAALIGAGWCLQAEAGQSARRPFVPRPSDIRPISRAQASAPLPEDKAAPSQKPPDAVKPGDTTTKWAEFNAASGGDVDEKTGITTGHDFTYKEGDMVVTGANARYNKKTKVLDADGRLALDNPRQHVTGDKAHVDNSKKAKLAVFTGSVVIVIKPKDRPADAGANEVAGEKGKGGTITCDRVDDYYKKDFAILTGHLTFKQKITKKDGGMVERTLTADHAEYDGKHDKMHLFPPVDVKDTDGQEAHFTTDALVGTKEGEETLESKGKISLKILLDDDADDSGDTSAGPPPAAGPAPAGAGKQEPPPVAPDGKPASPIKKSP